jgi:phosphoglucomutase
MTIHALAGHPAPSDSLADLDALRAAYYARTPDPDDRAQRVEFSSSGHHGSALRGAFTESHIRAITQAICDYRYQHGIRGPLFIGRDTHALSEPAFGTALEVLTINRVHVMLEANGGCTPAPAVSRAILTHNRRSPSGIADGIVVSASNNLSGDGGVKYNPATGGPAETATTRWIEARANGLLASECGALSRLTYARARRPNTIQVYDFIGSYVRDLSAVIDMDAIRRSGLRIGVDPLGGAAGNVWTAIADRYGVDIEIINSATNPTFRFMRLDQDGQIRMDCSSPNAMTTLIGCGDRFDIAVGNDTDAGRYGVVTRANGLMGPNDSLAVAASYLFSHRRAWRDDAAVGKTAVSSGLIDRVASSLGRRVVEVPMAFKWFVPGLLAGSLGLGGDDSASASFLQRDGATWTTDRDGIVMDLLAVESMARTGRDPSELYDMLIRAFGKPASERIEVPATPEQQALLATLTPRDVTASKLGDDAIVQVLTAAPGNGAPLGGVKVATAHAWFAARPAGAEAVYTLYAESFKGSEHLERIQTEARAMLSRTLAQMSR